MVFISSNSFFILIRFQHCNDSSTSNIVNWIPIQSTLTFKFSNFNYIHFNSQYSPISKPDFHRLLDDLFYLNHLNIMHFTCCWMLHFSLYHN